MFARDRDMWVMEPSLFTEIRFASQRTLVDAPMTVASDGITAVLGAGTLSGARVGLGSVLELNGLGVCEVEATLSDVGCRLSRLRPDREGPAIPLSQSSWSGQASGWTFSPQIGSIHRMIMSLLGLDVDGQGAADGSPVPVVLNPGELAHVEAVGALQMVYSAVSQLAPPDSPIRRKAERYSELFGIARQRVRAVLDLDGDGVADATRLVSLNNLRRA